MRYDACSIRQLLLPIPLALTMVMTNGCVRSSPPTGTTSGTGSGSPNAVNSTQSPRSSDALRRYPLDTLPTTTVSIGEHVFRVWLAQSFDPNRPGVFTEGLMHVPPEELADDEGMLFVFADEDVRGFWMLNTPTPLDIAYARMNGTIVTIAQMTPFDLRTHSSLEPAMFALEVKQGTFDRLGIEEGDRMQIPPEALRVQP